ncbi:uncharacterized protein M6D78_009741 [Vipera latastei]
MAEQKSLWDAQTVEGFLLVNGITDDRKKAAALLTICGTPVYRVAVGLCQPQPVSSVPYADLLAKLKVHFTPRRSELFWRRIFEKRNQRPGESIQKFVAAVREAAVRCKYDNLEIRIRDRVVLGLRDEQLQNRIIAKPTGDLQDVLDELLTYESTGYRDPPRSSMAAAPEINQEGYVDCGEVDQQWEEEIAEVSRRFGKMAPRQLRSEGPEPGRRQQPATPQRPPTGAQRPWRDTATRPRDNETQNRCGSCGGNHSRASCRFRTAKCRACGKTGHIQAICRNRVRDTRLNEVDVWPEGFPQGQLD